MKVYKPKNGFLICSPLRTTNQEAQYVMHGVIVSSSDDAYGKDEVIVFLPADAVPIGKYMAVHAGKVISEIVTEGDQCQVTESPQKSDQTKKGAPTRTRPVTATSRPSA